MSLVLKDRVRETTTVLGTNDATLLGAVTGFQAFSVVGNGNTCYYTISDQSGGNWEVGIGTYSTVGPTLARTTILASSNSGSIVSFPAGTKDVFLTLPAEVAIVSSNNPSTSGYVLTSNGTGVAPSWQVNYNGDVVGPASSTDNAITRFDGTTGKLIQNSSAILDDSGNIGLGVTPSAWASGIKAIQLDSTSSIYGDSSITPSVSVSNNGYYDGAWKYITTNTATNYFQNAGAHVWRTAISGTAGSAISWTQPMTLDASGNLGINTSSPSAKLQVNVANSGSPLVAANFTNGTNADFQVQIATNYSSIGPTTSTPLVFVNGGGERMRLDSSGNLGLGVTPSAWLSGWKGFELGGLGSGIASNGSSRVQIGTNNYLNGSSSWIYSTSAASTQYIQASGAHYWMQAPSGTAGNAISFTQAMTLDANGKLLVGTTTAVNDGNLLVQLNAASGAAKFFAVNRGDSYGVLFGYNYSGDFASVTNVANTPLTFGTNNTERMRIDSSGSVGIGVTPSAWSGFKVLEFTNGTYIGNYTASNNAFIGANSYFDGSWRYKNTAYAARYQLNGYDGSHIWFTAPSGTAGTTATFTQAMTLDASGNLGIGTTSPSRPIDVVAYADSVAQVIRGRTSDNLSAIIWNSNNNATSYAYAQGGPTYLAFGTANTERMRIDSSGNVGIGTSSPATKLEVYGAAGFGYAFSADQNVTRTQGSVSLSGTNIASLATYSSVGGSTTVGQLYYYASIADGYQRFFDIVAYGSTTGAGSNIRFLTGSSTATERMRIDGSGNVGIGTSSPAVKLQVNGATAIQGSGFPVSGKGWEIFVETATACATQSYNRDTSSWMTSKWWAGDHQWLCGGTERMRIDSNGILLVGTTSLATGFSGYAQIEASGSSGGIVINSSLGSLGRLIFTNSNASGHEGLIRYDTSGYSMQFWTNATEAMRIDSSGNVLIGGTSALNASKFLVVGDVNGEVTQSILNSNAGANANARLNIGNANYNNTELTITAYSDTASGTVCGVSTAKLKAIFDNSASTASNGLLIGTSATAPLYFSTSATERMRIDSSGNLLVGTTAASGYKLNVAGAVYSNVAPVSGQNTSGSGYNLNTLLSPGAYTLYNIVNGPSGYDGSAWALVEVFSNGSDQIWQRWTNAPYQGFTRYIRGSTNGGSTWGSWQAA